MSSTTPANLPQGSISAPIDRSKLTFSEVHQQVENEKRKAETELESVSDNSNPNAASWIEQAKQLQNDIQESKTVAQEIFKKAEEANAIHSRQEDAAQKVDLLQAEVDFTTALDQILQRLKNTDGLLRSLDRSINEGRLSDAVDQHKAVEGDLAQLNTVRRSFAVSVLSQRADQAQHRFKQEIDNIWGHLFKVNIAESEVCVPENFKGYNSSQVLTWSDVARAASELGVLDEHVSAMGRGLDKALFEPLLSPRHIRSSIKPQVHTSQHTLRLREADGQIDTPRMFEQLLSCVEFLNERLPRTVIDPLQASLMPDVTSRLISSYLTNVIPLSLSSLEHHQHLLDQTESFAQNLSSLRWGNPVILKEWAGQAPKVWLAKKREVSIGSVRDILSTGLQNRKSVERVETQEISRGDVLANTDMDAEAWDTDWKEGDEALEEEEDTSAWDAGDTDKDRGAAQSPWKRNDRLPDDNHENEDDAWGWGDEHKQGVPSSPVKKRKMNDKVNGEPEHQAASTKELTLRETYTITGVPDEVQEIVFQLIRDAQTLREPGYQKYPASSAALGLYSVPTLVLAGYRAIAANSYQRIDGGNMLLYNDCMRLSEELAAFVKELQEKDEASGQPRSAWPSTRMKLENDIVALQGFGRRAYGREMESQRTIIRDLVDGAQGFANCTEAPFADECDNAVAMTIDHLRSVAKQYQTILGRNALLQTLGSLLSTVTNKMILDIEDMSAIGDEESKRLRHYCNEICKLGDLFTQEREEGAKEEVTALYTPDWIKFQYLSEIMESSLADIRYLWTEAQLKLEFEAEEVVDLVEALFADTTHRRQAINEIRQR
ncbi:MAG: ribosome biogenesis protein ytm1 [Alyxoria varia]|nr:MAG: ribosome biogenesis protein ytm1 [Alyxoria varia]